MYKTIILVIGTLLLFTSCSQEKLTEERAEQLLLEHFGFPIVESKEMVLPTITYDLYTTFYNRDQRQYDRDFTPLVHLAIFDVKEEFTRSKVFGRTVERTEYHFSLTDYGQKLNLNGSQAKARYRGEWITCLRKFNGLTGLKIAEDGKSATAEFEAKRYRKTGFFNYAGYEQDIFQESVSLLLYEDGWRVDPSANQIGTMTLEQYPHKEVFEDQESLEEFE